MVLAFILYNIMPLLIGLTNILGGIINISELLLFLVLVLLLLLSFKKKWENQLSIYTKKIFGKIFIHNNNNYYHY